MSKPNKDGWIRHRGGKCPVALGSVIDVRYRDGKVIQKHFATENPSGEASTNAIWQHRSNSHDIMAYRVHKPAEQPVIDLPQGYGEVITATLEAKDGPLQWRDRIREIDRTVEALEEERVALVQRLEGEGFRLIERAVQPVEDMSDWRNWKAGDIVQSRSDFGGYTCGKTYEVKSVNFDRAVVYTKLDYKRSKTNGWNCKFFKFHSRPSK